MVGSGLRGAERENYQPAVDGLRAIAVIAVVAFHGGLSFARGGFLGVSLFFTISGYVITSLLLREYRSAHGHIRLRRFWARRYRRLMPAALLTIAGIAIAAPHFADTVQRAHLRGDLLGALGYVANWRFLARGTHYADLFGAPSPALHFWSLAIEEQFYIVFPLVVAAVLWRWKGSRRALAITIAALIAASVAWQVVLHDVDRVYLGSETRAAELLAGALLAVALAGSRRPTRRWSALGTAGLVVFAFLAATTSARASWIGDGGLVGVAAVNVAIVGSAAVGSRALRFLAARPLTAIGRVSYGIYLFHWPVFVWVDERRTGMHGVTLALVRCAIVAAITLVSYHFLECPIRYGRALPRARRFVPATVVAVAAVLALTTVVPQAATRPLLDVHAMPAPPPTQLAASRAGPRPPLRVMVVGNDLGRLAAWALATLPDHPFIVDNATRSRCPIVGVAYTRRFASDPPFFAAPCTDWPYRWVAEARTFKPDIVLVFSTAESDEMGRGAGTWVDLALMPLYQQVVQTYSDAATILRSTGAVVAWATIPAQDPPGPSGAIGVSPQQRALLLNSAISIVSQRQLGVVSLDFARHVDAARIAPRAEPLHAQRWFEKVVDLAYRAARHELALPDRTQVHRPLRVLVGGDSTSLNIAVGLANHGILNNDVVVDWAGQIACPLVRATRFREIGQSDDFDTHRCAPFSDGWATHFRSFQPDVVLVVSSFMDASALQRPGGAGWEHLGEPAFDAWVLGEFDAAYAVARRGGARVAWATAPLEDSPTDSGTYTLRQRLHRYNELLVALRLRHPDLIVVPLADHVDRPDGVVVHDQRPDGVHFTADAGRAIADQWLAKALTDQVKI